MIETERLRLRDWRESDIEPFIRHTNTEPVMRWLGGVKTDEEHRDIIEDRLMRWQAERGFTFWAVERNADGALLGFCGLKIADGVGSPIAGEYEIGWRLREDAWGQGYAKEAAAASLDLAFGQFEAPQVVAVTALGNVPSQGLMKRLGMVRREELDFVDQRFPADSEVNPQVVFTIDAAAWAAARQAALA